jgi:hypothetical protein
MKWRPVALLLLCALILVAVPFMAQASQVNLSENDLDEYLRENGFPEDYISILHLEQKKYFYENQGEFVSYETTTSYLGEDGYSQETVNGKNISPMTMDNFTATLGTVQLHYYNKTGFVRYAIAYNWTWNQRANFNLTDKFGIAWTDDWDILPETAQYGYTPYGVNSNGQNGWRSFSWYGQDEYSPGNGIGWAYDILHDFTGTDGKYYETYKHTGYGMVDIIHEHNGSGSEKSSSASAKYFHKQFAIGGTLSFNSSGKPSVSISNAINYDATSATAHQWFWKQKDY